MQRSSIARLTVALLFAGSCGFAAAQTVTIEQDSGERQTVPTEAAEETPAEPAHTCLRNTGSRIVEAGNRRAAKDGKPQRCANAFGRVYTAEDLESTGHVNIADALRSLDPRVR